MQNFLEKNDQVVNYYKQHQKDNYTEPLENFTKLLPNDEVQPAEEEQKADQKEEQNVDQEQEEVQEEVQELVKPKAYEALQLVPKNDVQSEETEVETQEEMAILKEIVLDNLNEKQSQVGDEYQYGGDAPECMLSIDTSENKLPALTNEESDYRDNGVQYKGFFYFCTLLLKLD